MGWIPGSPSRSGSARSRQRRRQRNQRDKSSAMRRTAPLVRPETVHFQHLWRRFARTLPLFHVPIRLSGMRLVGVALAFSTLLVALPLLQGRIFTNVWSLGVHLGGLTVERAAERLTREWQSSIQIRLIDGTREWTARPSELGLILDGMETARRARNVGLAGFPLGFGVTPVVTIDTAVSRAFLDTLAIRIDIAPVNAGYEWRAEELFGVPGRKGRRVDVAQSLAALVEYPMIVAEKRLLELTVDEVEPEVADPERFHEQAYLLVSRPFEIRGYDPFADETIIWTTTQAEFASWLEARSGGLTLREGTFSHFIDAQNATLDIGTAARYIEAEEAIRETRASIESGISTVSLRIRQQPGTYTVAAGDSGYRIARKIGVPYYLLEEANPGRDLSVLSPGDLIRAPSPDAMVPLNPSVTKRIVVDLERQYLVAYENGDVRFSWPISSGIDQAPTSPGVYQILSHVDVAYGSSYTLCGETGCGQWEMNWFMGIYEVVPGLVNGFHGAVLLPNGGYLGGGNVGSPYTFGCVMSRDEDARALYEWADEGTVVEIVSSEYEPRSALGQRTVELAAAIQGMPVVSDYNDDDTL